MKFFYLFVLLFYTISLSLFSQVPATEVRAVWLTTNWGLDWPAEKKGVAEQKRELQRLLDEIQKDNFNVVLFQARAHGRVLYKSKIEQASPFYNSSENFDPLAFAVAECHKRGLECHAWLVTYPMEKATVRYTGKGKRRKAVVVKDKPDHYKEIGGRWYLDPGRPETRKHLMGIVKEIVSKYDVDGIHFDYIRYPSNTMKFPDEDSYKRYGKGTNLHDWRRQNITQLVSDIYDEVKSLKKWVQVSSSPLGRYKPLPGAAQNDGWTAYGTVFQDAGGWMKLGKHDLLFPMMYHRGRYFYPYLDDWMANSNGRIVVPGLGVYQMDELNWSLSDIVDQMKYTRAKKVSGQSYFRTRNILGNLKGIRDSIRTFYPTPSKLPPLTWLDNEAPNSPVDLQVYKDKRGNLNITWEAPDNTEGFTYNVYASATEDFDKEDPNFILATGIRSNSYSFPVSTGDFGFYYFVTASDRFHNESVVCFPAYFVHSDLKK
ncbi:glycoside hydrolase family 10 protein [Dysgonomonas sp. 511]|uniref:glycoside hydrolase family 10 protein n=1 Tax=Dysgonomonas sp. 511 TaxID=2302930 RepID=UPI0013D52D16|nr:family 10 glycosylhydrolase [Dysgonomonas sp. 511]NDV80036.1 hypothetical protein [Dysgonomonas sp. 511]